MNVIALLGSPRRGGNTELLLKEAIRGVEESGGPKSKVKLYDLCRMNIEPCSNCGECEATGICIINDDMEEIAESIRGASRIILSSPIFFFGLSAQAKAMIDRCQQFWCEKYLLKKPIPPGESGRKGLLIVVGGMKKELGVNCSDATATAFFRTVSVPEHATLSFLGVDSKAEILKHPTAMRDAYEAGKKLVENLRRREDG